MCKKFICQITSHTPPQSLSENEVGINTNQFAAITGKKAGANRLTPWKGRIVRLSSEEGALYRLLHGLQIPSSECWIGVKTMNQLNVKIGGGVTIQRVCQPWGRLIYYWNHCDDTVRVTARIGLGGLFFAIASIGLSLLQLWLALK